MPELHPVRTHARPSMPVHRHGARCVTVSEYASHLGRRGNIDPGDLRRSFRRKPAVPVRVPPPPPETSHVGRPAPLPRCSTVKRAAPPRGHPSPHRARSRFARRPPTESANPAQDRHPPRTVRSPSAPSASRIPTLHSSVNWRPVPLVTTSDASARLDCPASTLRALSLRFRSQGPEPRRRSTSLSPSLLIASHHHRTHQLKGNPVFPRCWQRGYDRNGQISCTEARRFAPAPLLAPIRSIGTCATVMAKAPCACEHQGEHDPGTSQYVGRRR